MADVRSTKGGKGRQERRAKDRRCGQRRQSANGAPATAIHHQLCLQASAGDGSGAITRRGHSSMPAPAAMATTAGVTPRFTAFLRMAAQMYGRHLTAKGRSVTVLVDSRQIDAQACPCLSAVQNRRQHHRCRTSVKNAYRLLRGRMKARLRSRNRQPQAEPGAATKAGTAILFPLFSCTRSVLVLKLTRSRWSHERSAAAHFTLISLCESASPKMGISNVNNSTAQLRSVPAGVCC